jgi:hypothetical protein
MFAILAVGGFDGFVGVFERGAEFADAGREDGG